MKRATKGRISQNQEIQQVFILVAEEQQLVEEHRLEKRFGESLNALKETLLTLDPQKNNLVTLARIEKQLQSIQAQLNDTMKRKYHLYSCLLYAVVAIKALFYIPSYFRFTCLSLPTASSSSSWTY